MSPEPGKTYSQNSPYDSPWTLRERLGMAAWSLAWTSLCRWTPKPFNPWRLFWLKVFGAHIDGKPFVHERARIQIPWNLTMRHRSCLGDRANAYSLGEIELKEGATVAQEAYLCGGTHRFEEKTLPLRTAKITIGKDAFIGARAFVLPGVSIGDEAVIGACSVVSKDMPEGMICYGNPCQPVRPRRGKTSDDD